MRRNCEFQELYQLKERLEQFGTVYKEEFIESCAKELAARLLRKVKKGTPVDTGHLRKSWMVGEVHKNGDTYEIEVINPVAYASYVAYGHRTKNHTGWVPGNLEVITIPEQKIQQIAPKVLEQMVQKKLEELFQ